MKNGKLLAALTITFVAFLAVPVHAQKSVTGHGEIRLESPFFLFEKSSFSAVRDKNGAVTGQFQIRDRFDNGNSDMVLHGVVTCMETQLDGTVRLGGIVTHTNAAAARSMGSGVVWQVVDGGKGGKKDELSDLRFGLSVSTVPLWCSGLFRLSTQRLTERGNITVKQ